MLAFIMLALVTGFVAAQDADYGEPGESTGIRIDEWNGFNVSGADDFDTPGAVAATLYETYTDITGTYTDVLKLQPPPGGYKPHSLAMTYEVPGEGHYRLSMWVWAEQLKGDIYIEFEHIGGEWESIAGSVEEPAPFMEGQWLLVKTDPNSYPNGVYLEAGEKFGLLTQGEPGIGLNNHTIYIRDVQIEVSLIEDELTEAQGPVSPLKGLFAGLEFGINSVNRMNDEKVGFNGVNDTNKGAYLSSTLGYENAFFDDAMYIYAELGLDTGFYYVEDEYGENTFPVKLYADFYADYSLYFGYFTLSLILKDTIDPSLVLNPRYNSGDLNMVNRFAPGLQLDYWMEDIGSFYFQAEVPFYYFYYWSDDTDSRIFLQAKLGWQSEFGLGAWVREDWILRGDKWEWAEPGHESINFGLSYWSRVFSTDLEVGLPRSRYGDLFITLNSNLGPFGLRIEAGIPKETELYGVDIAITPKIQYTFFNHLSVYARLVIGGIGSKEYDIYFTPSLGALYRF